MALLTDKSLFIHVQKSGGMFVRNAMRLCDGPIYESGPVEVERHFGMPELRAAHPGIERGRLTFGFVRHPVSWLRSRWTWAVESGYSAQSRHRPAAAKLWLYDCWAPTFPEFVDLYLSRHAGICTRTHFHMLGIWGDGDPVDRIGRVERLADDLIGFLAEAGEVFDADGIRAMPRQNPSPPMQTPLWPIQVQQIIDAEAPMMELFYADAEWTEDLMRGRA